MCSAAQLVIHARALLQLGLRKPSAELMFAWLEELHTKRSRLTPLHAVEVLRVSCGAGAGLHGKCQSHPESQAAGQPCKPVHGKCYAGLTLRVPSAGATIGEVL